MWATIYVPFGVPPQWGYYFWSFFGGHQMGLKSRPYQCCKTSDADLILWSMSRGHFLGTILRSFFAEIAPRTHAVPSKVVAAPAAFELLGRQRPTPTHLHTAVAAPAAFDPQPHATLVHRGHRSSGFHCPTPLPPSEVSAPAARTQSQPISAQGCL